MSSKIFNLLILVCIGGCDLASYAAPNSRKFKIVTITDHEAGSSAAMENLPYVIRISPPDSIKRPTRTFYIQAAAHGDEANTVTFAEWLARRIVKSISPLSNLPVAFDIVPTLNVYGYAKRQRSNQNSVNLNRNFAINWGLSREFPGKQPFSEPETSAVQKLFSKTKYSAAVDIHGYTNWIIIPSTPTELSPGVRFLATNRISRYEALRAQIANIVSKNAMSYEVKTAGGLGDGGAFEDWAFWSEGVPAFCLEMDSALGPEKEKEDLYVPFLKYEALIFDFFNETADQSKV